jgi:hypothetical protein
LKSHGCPTDDLLVSAACAKKYPRLARRPDFITQRQHLEVIGRRKKFLQLDVIAVLSLDYDTDVKQTRCREQTLFRRRAATLRAANQTAKDREDLICAEP